MSLSGGYGFQYLQRAIRALAPLMHIEEPTRVTVDLSRVVFVGPTALALLVASMRRLQDLNLLREGGIVVPPNSPPVRNYLLRMNLIRALAGGEVLEEPFDRREPVGFRPCRHFTDFPAYAQVARDLTEALRERCEMDEVAYAAVRVCLDEITENVVHHADTELGGFAAAQGWPTRHEFEIGIVDLGVGIRASLRRNLTYADIPDDLSAVATALQPHVTATPERNAGIGLFVTKRLLAANGGALVVRSGNGEVQAGATEYSMIHDVAVPGTLVAVRARTDQPLDINAVYAQLPKAEHLDDGASSG